MAKEEIIVDLRIEKDQSGDQVNNLTSSIIALTKANKELIEQNKLMEAAGQDNSKQYIENTKQLEINKQKIAENSASRKSLIQSITAEDNSIKQLKIRNAELIKQRDQISTSTSEGRQRIKELNKEIDKNSEAIRTNSSEAERQKQNIGNYQSALDGLIPGFEGMTNGIMGATKASLAFIATPIGAIIGALGLAVAALTAYFKGSEEGQDRLARITAILGVAFEKLMVVFEAVGEAIFNGIEGFGALSGKLGVFGYALDALFAPLKLLLLGLEKLAEVTGFSKVVDDTIKAGDAINDMNDKIDAHENELIVKRAETNKQVQQLREEAITQEGELKAATITEAIRLEKELADMEKQQHEDRLKAFDLEAANTGKLTEEQKKKRAELVAAIINAEAEGAAATIKFQKELEGLNDAMLKARNDQIAKSTEHAAALAKEAAEIDAYMKKVMEKMNFEKGADGEAVARKDTAFEKEKKINQERIDMGQDFLAQETKIMDERTVSWDAFAEANHNVAIQQSKDKKKGIEETEKAALADAKGYADVAGAAAQAMGQQTSAGKAFAIAQIAINAGISVAQAITGATKQAWPLNLIAILSGISAVMAGIAQAKAIMKFAKGGLVPAYANGGRTSPLSGTRIMNHHGTPVKRSNGDNRLATVKTGEVILNEQQQSALGGPATFRAIGVPGFATGGTIQSSQIRTAARQAESTLDMQQLAGLINTVVPVLVLEDFEAKQSTVNAIEQRAQVI